MGLFDKIFGKPKELTEAQSFKMLTAYQPVFRTWQGQLYESQLVRSAVHAIANHTSKLKFEMSGTASPRLRTKLEKAPNSYMTWSQFLYRLRTILECQNTAIMVPVTDEFGDTVGIYPILPSRCEIVSYRGTEYLRYTFQSGDVAAVELNRCGIVTKMQYRSDFFGETNDALRPTMSLINTQNQAIEEAAKSSASFRFMAKLSNFALPEDIAKEQRRFTENNLSADAGGMLLFPSTYTDIKQINSNPFVIDDKQISLIYKNVYQYFGVSEDILENKAYGDSWSAFYEGNIESFAIQLSDVMTRMIFSEREMANGNGVMFTANRLQYLSNTDKMNLSQMALDRGLMSRNEVREIWNMAPIEGGDSYVIRGEYKDASDVAEGDENDG